jgi:hypothetical protein
VKTTLPVGEQPSTRYGPKMACSTTLKVAHIVDATRSIVSRAPLRLLTLTFDISPLPSPRNWAMPGWSHGYRAALTTCLLTQEPISSLRGTGGSKPSISFSTSYPEICILTGWLLSNAQTGNVQ